MWPGYKGGSGAIDDAGGVYKAVSSLHKAGRAAGMKSDFRDRP